MLTKTAAEVFASTDAAGALRSPSAEDASVWGSQIERAVGIAGAGSGLIYPSRSSLYADLAHAANASAWVIGDATVAYNGVYKKTGASGAGSWSRVWDLPYQVVALTASGSANAIVATSPLPVPSGGLQCLLPFVAPFTNTGAVSIEINGASPVDLTSSKGEDLDPGDIVAGTIYFAVPYSGSYRLTVESDFAAAVAAAEAAADAAEAAKNWVQAAAVAYQIPSPMAYGAVGDGTTDDTAAVVAANAVAGYIRIDNPHRVAGGIALGRVIFGPFGRIVTAPGAAVTIAEIADTTDRIFDTSAGGTISLGQSVVRPDWWGAVDYAVAYAVAALPSTGGDVLLLAERYRPCHHVYGGATAASAVYFSKDNVRFLGSGCPSLNSDCSALTGGTVIEGTILAYANNLTFSNLGIDCGKGVVTTYSSGAIGPGFIDALAVTFPHDQAKSEIWRRRGLRLHNVIGLAYSPSAAAHGVIAGEGYYDISMTGTVSGVMGVHGVVIKGSDVHADQIVAHLNGNDGVIIKSDGAATAARIQIGRIYTRSTGPAGLSPWATPLSSGGYGVLFNPDGGNISHVQIGEISSVGAAIGVGTAVTDGYSVDDVEIGSISSSDNSQAGLSLVSAGVAGSITRWSIGSANLDDVAVGMTLVSQTDGTVDIGVLRVSNSPSALSISSYPRLSCGHVIAENLSDGALTITASAKPKIGRLTRIGSTRNMFTAAAATYGLIPALNSAWSQASGNDQFGIVWSGGSIALTGLVVPNGSGGRTVATLPPYARPALAARFVAQGYSGGTGINAVPVTVGSDGTVVINETTTGTANCSSWLSLSGIAFSTEAP